jgi:hypothetical protein
MQSARPCFDFSEETMSRTLLSLLVLGAICVSAALAAPQKIYKWTDANGQVHYTSTPPPTTVKAQELKHARAGTPAPVGASGTAANAQTTATDASKPEMSAEQKAQLTGYCQSVRSRIDALANAKGTVAERNPDGSQTPLDPTMIAQKISEARANEDKYCTANGM